MATKTTTAIGRIARVTGPVVDIEFPHDAIPEIYNALTTVIDLSGEKTTLTLEVAQHLGDDLVRAIALKPTDGLVRGGLVSDTGAVTGLATGLLARGLRAAALGGTFGATAAAVAGSWAATSAATGASTVDVSCGVNFAGAFCAPDLAVFLFWVMSFSPGKKRYIQFSDLRVQ